MKGHPKPKRLVLDTMGLARNPDQRIWLKKVFLVCCNALVGVKLILETRVLLLFLATSTHSQARSHKEHEDVYAIVAPNGLLVRETESLKSPIVGKLPFGSLIIATDGTIKGTGRVELTFPYPGYISVAPTVRVRKIVGELEQQHSSVPVEESALECQCCTWNATPSSMTWKEWQSGRYSSSSLPLWVIPTRPLGTNSWLDQVPIGSVRTGALVGGDVGSQVLPLSTAGLFVPPPQTPTPADTHHPSWKDFCEARKALLRGDASNATRLADEIFQTTTRTNPMAMFQYAADITFVATLNPMTGVVACNDIDNEVVTKQAIHGHSTRSRSTSGRILPWQQRTSKQSLSPRNELVQKLLSSLTYRDSSQPAITNHTLGSADNTQVVPISQTYGAGQLDLKHGIYRENFVSQGNQIPQGGTDGTRTEQLLHHREWFLSFANHIVIGRLKCRTLPEPFLHDHRHVKSQKSKCLNLAFSISRSDGLKSSVISTALAHLLDDTSNDLLTAGANHYPNLDSTRAALHLSIDPQSGTNTTAPTVHVCGVITCHSEIMHSYNSTGNLQVEAFSDGRVTCSSAASADIFILVEIASKGNDIVEQGDTSNHTPKGLRSLCEARLVKALQEGYTTLRKTHSEDFGRVMEGTDFHFHTNEQKDPRLCDGHALSDVLQSNLDCSKIINHEAKEEERELKRNSSQLTPSLLRRQFQYSRYLLLSSASAAVPNLQGIWADGPTSAWNGDYHLNVNLQMMYWGTGPTGLAITHQPLLTFIKALAQIGRGAARNVYNCTDGSAWVSHGNTDHTLDGRLHSESHWVFCSSCGLWAALQLFENFIYSPLASSGDKLKNVTSECSWKGKELLDALGVLRGNIQFFMHSTFVDSIDGFCHTGPTTSPENSYVVIGNVSSVAQHLSFTPAFDASLLRQLANAFPLLAMWARKHVVVGASGIVLEYPTPLASAGVRTDVSPPVLGGSVVHITKGGRLEVMEGPDPGHRHFSGMHWLYPNTFVQTRTSSTELMTAARATLDWKRDSGGGHTGWSTAWDACLRARIRDGQGTWAALSRLVRRYTAYNGLALHPPLAALPRKLFVGGTPGKKLPKTCTTTCAYEADKKAGGSDFGPLVQRRGMETSRGDKFQLDAHGGLVAAVAELLLLSHFPGTLLVLPGIASLPTNAVAGGAAFDLRGRGDVSVSVTWSGTGPLVFDALELSFRSHHPWLDGSHWSERFGLWHAEEVDMKYVENRKPSLVRVYIPASSDLIMDSSNCGQCIDNNRYNSLLKPNDNMSHTVLTLPSQMTKGMTPEFFLLESFPCSVTLCSSLALSGHVNCHSVFESQKMSFLGTPME